ncbi:MAG: GAF domain-containing protein [Bacteroidales bacterium]|nr:GAF domain-containing protein [Bacteroidales bacterium]
MENNREMNFGQYTGKILKKWLKPARLKLNCKIRMILIGNLLIALIIFILFAWLKQRNISVSSAYETLTMTENIKKQHLEDELKRLQSQLSLFAMDSRTLGAFNSLWQAFREIESDNFYTADAGSMEEVRSKLENYFLTEVLPEVEGKTMDAPDLEDFLADDPKQTIAQFLYLASNTKPMGSKQDVTGAGDGTLYSGVHVQYQPWLLSYAQKNKITDLYFIDTKSGYVFYTLKKYPDFGTNLFTGRYKNSMLAYAFRSALATTAKSNVVFTDMDRRIPGYIPPCFYLSAPVMQGNQKTGVIIFSIEAKYLDEIMVTGTASESDYNTGISTMVIGTDKVYRSNDPDFLANNSRFMKKLRRHRITGENAEEIMKSSCTAMNLKVSGDAFADAAGNVAGQGKYITPDGRLALCSYSPVNIPGLNWILVTRIPFSTLLGSSRSLVIFLIVLGLVVLVLLGIITSLITRRIALRAEAIKGKLASLSNETKGKGVSVETGDELDVALTAMDNVVQHIGDAAQFASRLSEGKLDSEFTAHDENDAIGISLNKLRQSMIQSRKEEEERKKEDDIRNWTNQGVAIFNDILRQDNNDMKKLAFNVIKNLIQYLSANQGGFFLLEEKQGEESYLNLIAAYAYERQKYLQKKILIGEGLVGNCVQEKQTIHLRDIPKDYIEIRSGLGGSVPRSLLIVPLKKEEQITGVVEIASFNEFGKHEIDFVEKVAESIAATMVTVRLHEQTAILLEESKKRSEEISQQEEELRQNLEELKATQEEMARIRKDEEQKEKERRESEQKMMEQLKEQQQLLSKEKALLDALLNNVPESIYFKDLKSRFIRFSASMLKLFKLSKPEELMGKSDFDMFDEEHSRPAYEDEQEIIRTGKAMVDKIEKEVLPDGRVNYVNTTKMPLRDAQNKIMGTFGISKDVTNFVNMQHDIEAKEELLKKKDKEIQQLQEEIKKLKKDQKKS